MPFGREHIPGAKARFVGGGMPGLKPRPISKAETIADTKAKTKAETKA